MDGRSLALARLQDCPGLGLSGLARVVEFCQGDVPDEIYERSPGWYQGEVGLTRSQARALSVYSPTESSVYATLKVRLLTRFDAEYPHHLAYAQAPPVVTAYGRPHWGLPGGNCAVLCSKQWESEHPERVKAAIQCAVEAGWVLVAGHNRPVYQWALLAAKRCATRAIMVLDRGLLSAFDADFTRDPVAAARIWGYSFDGEHCTAVSRFRLRDGWMPSHGPLRDELVAGLADVVVAMGVRPGGITHHVCLSALARGGRVLVDDDALKVMGDQGARRWEGVLPSIGA